VQLHPLTAPDDPAALIVQSSEDQRVTSAVRTLSPRAREIVMLYAWEDLAELEAVIDTLVLTP
jgi:DNA-directed RNA polymerase specialized sigma24 family protein